MATETQQSISEWAEETFGPVGSNLRVACRANEEMAELLRALSVDDNSPKAAEEAADVKIVLYRLAARMGFDFKGARPFYNTRTSSNFERAAWANASLSIALNALASLDDNRASEVAARQAVAHLHALGTRMGFDLNAEVDKKMAVNRRREWRLDGSGHGYHVRDKSPSAVATTSD